MPSKPSARSTYASIMILAGLDPDAEGRIRLATGLADHFGSRIIGVAAEEILAPLYFEAPAEGVASIIEIEERKAKEDIAKAESMFRRIAGVRDGLEWRSVYGAPVEFVATQARAADLIVVGRPPGTSASQAMGVDPGDLLMNAGRPVLLVPPRVDHLSAKRIAVAWKDTREARRAVFDSVPMLAQADEVFVVSIGSEDQGARDVAAYLGRHGIQALTVLRPETGASAGDQLLRIVEEQGADLIVCGAYGHSRAREWVFGGVTRDLLDHAPICCLMSH
jgi:nucleotide-binding universal stress UspA family protein